MKREHFYRGHKIFLVMCGVHKGNYAVEGFNDFGSFTTLTYAEQEIDKFCF